MSTGSLGTRRAYVERYELPEPLGNADARSGRSRGLLGWYNDVPAQLKGLIVVVLIFAALSVQSALAFRTSLESQHTAEQVART